MRYDKGYIRLPEGDVTDWTELIDVVNNFDPVAGIFTVDKDEDAGIYMFLVSGYKDGDDKVWAEIYKNDEYGLVIREESSGPETMLSGLVTLHLEKGDKVKLYNKNAGSIYVGFNEPLTLTGYKI